MGTKVVNGDQIGAEIRANFEEQGDAIRRGVIEAAQSFEGVVVAATPSDRGQARAGWRVEIEAISNSGAIARLTNDVPYIGILELGSRPHYPPLFPILEWVVRNFGLGLEAKTAAETDDGPSPREAIQAAPQHFDDLSEVPYSTVLFAKGVQEKIARKGTEPHEMVGDNLGTARRLLERALDKHLSGVD